MDLNKIVQGITSSGAVSGFAGGLAGSALAGSLGGKKGKKLAKGALKVGALAAVGGLAYKAYQRYQQGNTAAVSGSHVAGAQSAAALPVEEPRFSGIEPQRFESIVADESSNEALLLVQAMIAAGSADGHLDAGEQDRVFEKAQSLPLSSEDKATLFDEIRNPKSMQQIVEQVNSPELAVEVYAASLVAVDESHEQARTWLRALAMSLQLPGELVESIHEEVRAARSQA